MTQPIQVWANHSHLYRRLRKTFYYGRTKKPIIECSSLPLTEVTVDMIEKSFAYERKSLGNLDVNYAAHILHQACISPASIMIAMLYLERIKNTNPDYLRQNSPSELFLVSLVIASKFLFDKGEDEIVYNDEWASFGNLDLEDLNRIEMEFLNALNWSCFVDEKSFMDQLVKFEGLVSINEYLKRTNSHMTYTELLSLLEYLNYQHKDNLAIWSNLNDFAKSIFICILAYCAAITIVMMSFSIVFSMHYAIQFNHQSMYQDNLTLTFVTINPITFELPVLDHSSPSLLTISQIGRQPNISKPLFNRVYHPLQGQKYNKLLKCS